MIVFKVLSIFPKYFVSPFMEGLLKQAINKGILRIDVINIRDFAHDKHKTVDDEPYGGGPGMVMKPEPIVSAIRYAKANEHGYKTIIFSPKGKQFNHSMAKQLSEYDKFILVCGRYEGIDERITEFYSDEELSIGDYVLSGGEAAALVFIESIARLKPGFVGNEASVKSESYENGLLEYPQYTKPRIFEGHEVPEILLSGNHKQIEKWRKEQSFKLTLSRRPDLLDKFKKDQHL